MLEFWPSPSERGFEEPYNKTDAIYPTVSGDAALAYGAITVLGLLAVYVGSKASARSLKNKPTFTSAHPKIWESLLGVLLSSLLIFGTLYGVDYLLRQENNWARTATKVALLLSGNALVAIFLFFLLISLLEQVAKTRGDTFDQLFVLYASVVASFMLWNLQHHWIANNCLVFIIAVGAIEHRFFSEEFYIRHCLRLVALYWLFECQLLVAIANSWHWPVRFLIPADLLSVGASSTNFVSLYIGDIIFPGAFISFLFRFYKATLHKNSEKYLALVSGSYCFCLLLSIVVRHHLESTFPVFLVWAKVATLTPFVLAWRAGNAEGGNLLVYLEDHGFPKIVKRKKVVAAPQAAENGGSAAEKVADDKAPEEKVK